MSKIYINKSNNIIQEVLTDNPSDEVYLVDFDENDSQELSEKYVDIMDNPDLVYRETLNILEKKSLKNTYEFTLTLTSQGSNSSEAWDNALQNLVEKVKNNEEINNRFHGLGKEEISDTVYLECNCCGIEEEVSVYNFGDWVSECYLGEQEISPICSDCYDKYCILGDDDIPEILLHKISFKNGKCRPLQKLIMDNINNRYHELGEDI